MEGAKQTKFGFNVNKLLRCLFILALFACKQSLINVLDAF